MQIQIEKVSYNFRSNFGGSYEAQWCLFKYKTVMDVPHERRTTLGKIQRRAIIFIVIITLLYFSLRKEGNLIHRPYRWWCFVCADVARLQLHDVAVGMSDLKSADPRKRLCLLY